MASLLLVLAGLALSTQVMAQGKGKPRWVDKSEESLDKKRYNETYQFKVFNTYGMDVNRLMEERFDPLMAYLGEEFGVRAETMRVDSLQLEGDEVMTYFITFPSPRGEVVMYAQRVDECCVFEDYVDNTYQYEFYQLYAVSTRPNVVPTFDDFELTRSYNSAAVALSIIPGMGQVYKGQKAKGYSFLGAEVAFVAGSIAFTVKKNYSRRKVRNGIPNVDSWKSKQRSWRQMRNMCLGLGGGLYVYNLIDAAVAKGNRQLIVNKAQQKTNVSFAPAVFSDGVGGAFVLNF